MRKETSEWRNGFLFVGNHLSLDFLNTRPIMHGAPVELLPEPSSLVRWASAADLLTVREAQRLGRNWYAKPAFATEVEELRAFRETLRQGVLRMEAGRMPSPAFLEELNRQLLAHPYVDQAVRTSSGIILKKRFYPQSPLDVLAPVIHSLAVLLALPDKSRLRKCRSCILHFYDTSKKGTRIWCSMQLCGNRSKVAEYSKRKRAGPSSA